MESFFLLKLQSYFIFIVLPYKAIDPIVLNFKDVWDLEMDLHFTAFLCLRAPKKKEIRG